MKRSLLKCVAGVTAALGLAVFVGCGNISADSSGEETTAKTLEDISPRAQSCVAILDLQTNAVEEGLNAISKYVDIGDASARALTSSSVELDDFIASLPDDYMQLSRHKSSSTRSAADAGETVTLGEELDEIAEKFEADFKNLIPDPSAALTLDYVQGTETGLLIGDDMEIPYNSIGGAMTVNVLNAIANGEDAEAMVKEIEEYVESNYDEDDTDTARAVWEASVGTWTNGVVNYRWGSISAEHKAAVLEAMRTWETKTGRKVRFNEYSSRDCNSFFVRICLKGFVTISDDDDISGRGKSTVGYMGGWFSTMQLRKTNLSGNELKRAATHELGHVLGLKHEHQRYDRDEYISVTGSGHNYKKIPEYDTGFRFESRKIRIGWFKVRIFYPIWWKSQHSYTLGEFDFKSVMLYENQTVKENKRYLNNGAKKTKMYADPSENDVRAICKLY